MADAITINVDDAEAERTLTRLQSIGRRGRDLHQAIGSTLLTLIALGFKMGRDPYGAVWAKLQLRSGQPLVDTGRLRSSITVQADATSVTVGTNLIYAALHQFGGTIVPVKARILAWRVGGRPFFAQSITVPARKFLPLSSSGRTALPPNWELAVVRRIQSFIDAQVPT